MQELPSVDMNTIQEMKDILEESLSSILVEFRNEIPGYKAELNRYHAANNIEQLVTVAHSVKSASGSLGFLKLSEGCRQLEEGLRLNPSMEIDALVLEANAELDNLAQIIESLI